MDRSNFLGRAVALVVTALLIIGLTVFIMSDAPREENDLPTKTDVIEWHVHGSWAYRANGRSFVYADLPGGCTVWDDLYKIQPNTVFVK